MKRTLTACLVSSILLAGAAAQSIDTVPAKNGREKRLWTELLATLRNTRVSVDWKEKPLKDAVDELRSMTKVNFVFGGRAAEELADRVVDLRLRAVSLGAVLELLAADGKTAFLHQGGMIEVTTPSEIVRRTAVLAIHDVRDLLFVPTDFPGPKLGIPVGPPGEDDRREPEPPEQKSIDELIDLVRSATGEENWNHEGVSIKAMGGRLVIRHTPAMQARIGRVLLLIG